MTDTAYPSRTLRLAAELADLAQFRLFVQESAGACGVAAGDVVNIVLAVDEAVTNVILHGYAGRCGAVELEVTRAQDALVIRLRDEAAPFDPTGVAAPDLTVSPLERASGGLGLHLIRQVMDQLTYRRLPGGGNELTMSKRIA
jgi:serine/threonine-protein kinase RsbW